MPCIHEIDIAKVIEDNASFDCVFVFNSSVACNSYARYIVSHSSQTHIQAISMENFIAWDEFKVRYLSVKVDGKQASSSIIRRIFMQMLLKENARAPFLKKVVPVEYAKDATHLANNIANILSALDMWHKSIEINGIDKDSEDYDYEEIYKRYKSFLANNNLFEQSWLTPNFAASGKRFILLYPNLLEDYIEYESLLVDNPYITLVFLPDTAILHNPNAMIFDNIRGQLHYVALYIRHLLSSGVNATDIAISVGDIDAVLPYLTRELWLYDIEFIVRKGKSILQSSSGKIFDLIYTCYTQDFSFDSVQALLQLKAVPYRVFDANGLQVDWTEALLQKASELHCKCAYYNKNDKIDVFEESFKVLKAVPYYDWYKALKTAVNAMVKAKTFKSIRLAWFKYWVGDNATSLLDKNKWELEATLVIGKAMTVLANLIDIEEHYCNKDDYPIDCPFEFFLNELRSTIYTPQQNKIGVNIFDYKVAACAAFDYNIVLEATENATSVQYKALDFLCEQKRQALKAKTVSLGEQFLCLYNRNNAFFGVSENGLSGYSTANSYLESTKFTDDFYNEKQPFYSLDIVNKELVACVKHNAKDFEPSIMQQKRFDIWKKRTTGTFIARVEPYDCIKKMINKALILCDGTVKITQKDMNSFFFCKRQWLLQNILKIQEEEVYNRPIINKFIIGTLNHSILQEVLNTFKQNNMRLPFVNNDLFDNELDIKAIVSKAVTKVFSLYKNNKGQSLSSMPLVQETILLQKQQFVDNIMNFLHILCKAKSGFCNTKVSSTELELERAYNDEHYTLLGKLDCILQDGDDYIILDFKNTDSSMPSIKSCNISTDVFTSGVIEDFQMPMYVALLDCDIKIAAFISIKSGEMKIIIDKNNKKAYKKYIPTLEIFNEYAKYFTQAILEYNIAPVDEHPSAFSKLNVYRDCPNCQYNNVCRMTFSIAGNH